MAGDSTYQGLTRLTYMPNRDTVDNGLIIAGQLYYDVFFTGGEISNVTLTNVTLNSLASPLPIASGGTGQTTANAALNALLPTQTAQSGKVLKTDGTNASWSADTDTGITQLTGDVTAGPGSGSQAATLATVNANVGAFGSSTAIPSFTVNGKGLITAASTSAVVAPAGTLTGTTLAANVVTSSLTSVGTITSGTWNGTDIAFSRIAQVGANTVLTNPTTGTADISTTALAASQLLGRGSTGNVAAITLGAGLTMTGTSLSASGSPPTVQYLTASGTYTTPANCRGIFVQMVGGGGGGGAHAANPGSAGGATTFNSIKANGGSGGNVSSAAGNAGGAGGTGGTGSASLRRAGASGWSTLSVAPPNPTTIFGGGISSGSTTSPGTNAPVNTGAGGGGASSNGLNQYSATSGGAGEYVEINIASPAASYSYTIGTGGAGGAAGTLAGGNGGSGFIKVTEFY